MPLILEVIVSSVVIGFLTRYVYQKNNFYGKYSICFTKGENQANKTYTTWMTRSYSTEEDYEKDEKQIFSIALDKDKNKSLKKEGITGLAFVDFYSGKEESWCALS